MIVFNVHRRSEKDGSQLTIDVERNPFADGRRDVVGRDAHVGGHHLSGDAVQTQRLSVKRLHFYNKQVRNRNPCLFIVPEFSNFCTFGSFADRPVTVAAG